MAEQETAEKDADSTENNIEETETEAEAEVESPDLSRDRGGFKCIAKQRVLRTYFDAFSTIVDEMKLHINQDGFYGAAVDPASVGMVEESLSESAFEHYSSTGGLLGINLDRIDDILGLASPDDLIEVDLDQETRKFHIQIGGLEYNVALIDPQSIREEPDIPDLDLPAEIVLEGAKLTRGVKAADMISDHILLRLDETGDEPVFIIEAEGDTDEVEDRLTPEDLIDLTTGAASSLFSLDYLKDFNKAIPKNREVRIKLGEEFPVKIIFDNIEVDDELHGTVTMMLAPRIQSD